MTTISYPPLLPTFYGSLFTIFQYRPFFCSKHIKVLLKNRTSNYCFENYDVTNFMEHWIQVADSIKVFFCSKGGSWCQWTENCNSTMVLCTSKYYLFVQVVRSGLLYLVVMIYVQHQYYHPTCILYESRCLVMATRYGFIQDKELLIIPRMDHYYYISCNNPLLVVLNCGIQRRLYSESLLCPVPQYEVLDWHAWNVSGLCHPLLFGTMYVFLVGCLGDGGFSLAVLGTSSAEYSIFRIDDACCVKCKKTKN